MFPESSSNSLFVGASPTDLTVIWVKLAVSKVLLDSQRHEASGLHMVAREATHRPDISISPNWAGYRQSTIISIYNIT
jgi:hypothetical protein